MKRGPKSCFILSSYDADLRTISKILKENKIKAYNTPGLFDVVKFPIRQVQNELQRADFVLLVLDNPKLLDAYIFEIGFTTALRKKLYAIITPSFKRLPLTISDIPYVRSNLDDENVLKIFFDIITTRNSEINQTVRSHIRLTREKVLGQYARKLLLEYRKSRMTESDFSNIVKKIIDTTGLKSFSQAKQPNVDFIVWLDGLDRIIENPLVIEIKHSVNNEEIILNLVKRAQFLEKRDFRQRWVLVLYEKGPIPFRLRDIIANTTLLFVDIEHFLEQLRDFSLTDIIFQYIRRRYLPHTREV